MLLIEFFTGLIILIGVAALLGYILTESDENESDTSNIEYSDISIIE